MVSHSHGPFMEWRAVNIPHFPNLFDLCRFSTFLGMVNESNHSFNNPGPYSLNTAIVAGSVQDTGVACAVGAAWLIVDGMRA